MPQNVPTWELSEQALQLRQFVYDHWGTHGVGPTLRDVHEGIGFDRRTTLQAYKELGLAVYTVNDTDTQNCNLIKSPPYSSFPSQVKAYLLDGDDARFFCFVGCAMESMAFSKMPQHAGRTFRLESWCACCLEPITFTSSEGRILERSPAEFFVHVSLSPWDWNGVDITLMCDSMNFVMNAEHAERYERQISRRGALFTIEQAQLFTKHTADTRGWNYHRPPDIVNPGVILNGIKLLGVDVSPWEG